jgi:hypothetical protein
VGIPKPKASSFRVHLQGMDFCVPSDSGEVFVAVGAEQRDAITCLVCKAKLDMTKPLGKILRFPGVWS